MYQTSLRAAMPRFKKKKIVQHVYNREEKQLSLNYWHIWTLNYSSKNPLQN